MPPDLPAVATNQESFGSQLRRHRTIAGLSQEALAARAGLSRRGIADLERGARRTPYPDTARRLADALALRGSALTSFMAASRPAVSAGPTRHALGVEPSPIIGRRAELAELLELSAGTRLLTLTGSGGIGKTRLALELAHRSEADYADGTVVVDLAPVADEAGVIEAIAVGLALGPPRVIPRLEQVGTYVRDRQLLIVMDNCEHLIAASARVTDLLLRSSSGLRMLITSREALRLLGESVWPVPGLRQDDAVALFVERAGGSSLNASQGAQPGARPLIDTIDAMCRHLEGIPLAIELAAARVRVLGVQHVAEHLSDRLGFVSGHRLDPPRHQTLRAALDWSYALLSADEQRLLSRLAVFGGGWTLEAAEIMGAEGKGEPATSTSVVDSLTGLIDKSLVLVQDVDGHRRFRFLETVREYALEILEATAEATRVHDRQVRYLQVLAAEGSFTRVGLRYPGDVRKIRVELANFRGALRWLLAEERFADGLDLCLAMSGFWLGQGYLREGQAWFDAFMAEPERIGPDVLAAGLHARGRLAEYDGALDMARDLYEQSRRASLEHGNPLVAARAACGLGDIALHHGDYLEAAELFGEALASARAARSESEMAHAMLSLGRAADLCGEPEQARNWLEQALERERLLGDRWGVAYALHVLAGLARQAAELQRAQVLLEEAHVLWRQAGTKMGERATVMDLALVTVELGSRELASAQACEALQLCVQLGDSHSSTAVRAVEIAAQVLSGQNESSVLVRLLALAAVRRAELSAPRPAGEEAEIRVLLAAAQAALGADAYEAAWAAGSDLELPTAIDLALQRLSAATRATAPDVG